MTKLIEAVYSRYQSLVAEIDIKEEKMRPWQINALHDLASEAEKVLQGCRRQSERRG